ncbi:YheC/YheD family protein [Sutcliffiella horikoshii]|uniref:YheC/YheD family endospore coat-associated protein n=1 Tax=Sutcliffiella horikoshii TaxID=79883 RepID=UPI001CBD1DDF|nr:YheC/YheD family protein [Sutcliffiella horikoshii]UAL48509.1 YheC/YheD family protein [Sutcliffiella horikoshii]
MITLGVLSFSQPTSYLTKMAEHAVENGVMICLISPTQLTEGTSNVSGLMYTSEKKEWKNSTFPIPSFIYDRCYYGTKKAQLFKAVTDSLKLQENIQFLGYGLPNKWEVYNKLSSIQEIQAFFPLTKKLTSVTFFLSHFRLRDRWLIKPINGSQGRGLIKVERIEGQYIVKEVVQPGESLYVFRTDNHLKKWLHSRMKVTEYIFQPFLPLQNKKDVPFDLRLLLQKNEDGNWKERVRCIRTGPKNHITSNLAGGGEMLPFSVITQGLKRSKREELERKLQVIVEHLPAAIDETISPLFELGIDIGIDPDYNLWILDINSKPGHKIVTMASPSVQAEIYEAPSKYCMYLSSIKR